MRAARYYGPRDVRIEDVEARSPGPNEVRIDVAACGICGSDLHAYVDGPGIIPEDPHPVTGDAIPITIGHEVGGTVVEVGEGVEGGVYGRNGEYGEGDEGGEGGENGEDSDVRVGTDVAVNPIVWCGGCRYCLSGSYHLCENGGFVGLSGGGGGFAEELVVSAEKVIPVPKEVPAELAALVEPFTVGLHAVHRSAFKAGDSVVVFGGGPIGLTVVQAARAAGAGDLFVSEPRDARRERAGECGADVLIDPRETDPVEYVREATGGGADVAFEVAGIEPTVNQAIECTRAGGHVTIVSLFEGNVSFKPNELVTRERTVTGTAAFQGGPRSPEEFRTTIRNFATGALSPELLVTGRIGLEDIVAAGYEPLLDDERDQVKILVRP